MSQETGLKLSINDPASRVLSSQPFSQHAFQCAVVAGKCLNFGGHRLEPVLQSVIEVALTASDIFANTAHDLAKKPAPGSY